MDRPGDYYHSCNHGHDHSYDSFCYNRAAHHRPLCELGHYRRRRCSDTVVRHQEVSGIFRKNLMLVSRRPLESVCAQCLRSCRIRRTQPLGAVVFTKCSFASITAMNFNHCAPLRKWKICHLNAAKE
ncbi:unnamed protein product, partial [Nesidiocoris tenuis]